MPDPFQPEDVLSYQTINEINCTSSLELIACTVESINKEQDSRFSAIWLVPMNGQVPFQFTSGSAIENTPRWSPDGSQLAFLSDRNSVLQIYLISRNGGEAKKLGNLSSSVITIEWSPDGRQLLAVCNLTVDPDLKGKRTNEAFNKSKDAPKLVWRLPYKLDGTGFILDNEKHLFRIDVLSGNHTQLTDGAYNVRSASWSPDSKYIAFTRTREGTITNRTDLWIMDAEGNSLHQVSHKIANTYYPRWSPDGSRIIFTGSENEGDAQNRLWLFDTKSGKVSALGSKDVEVVSGDSVYWLGDSRIIFVRAWQGRQEIASITVSDGTVKPVVRGDRQIDHLAVTKEKLVFISENAVSPNEIYCTTYEGAEEEKLSCINDWSNKTIPILEARSFIVPDGTGGDEAIEGWLLKPSNISKPYPLLIDVHGGPASYVYLKYNWHSYWHVLVSQGWAILALNTVGSSSFGREFGDRLRAHWGEFDLGQQLAAVDILRNEGVTDDRIAITGKSYGGYLAAWAITHTDVFRAAVVSAPVINLEAHFGISDSGYYSDPYAIGDEPQGDEEKFQRLSPITHAEKVQTPTLILQGEEDERCPKSQAEELFTRLMITSNIPVEMVLYPKGSHHFFETGRPSHCVDAVKRLVSWVNRWTQLDQGQK